jgi:type II secretory pathway pseudopilin PulG
MQFRYFVSKKERTRMYETNRSHKKNLRGILLRFLLSAVILGVISGILLPIALEKLTAIEERKAQERAERIIENAARWYIINNGNPSHTLQTEEVKQVLIPHYLNRWPGEQPIECRIDPQGQIHIWTIAEQLLSGKE